MSVVWGVASASEKFWEEGSPIQEGPCGKCEQAALLGLHVDLSSRMCVQSRGLHTTMIEPLFL